MKKMTGWQKAGLFAGVGCFSILAILVIGITIAVVRARSMVADLGDPTPRRVERSISLADTAAASPERAPASAPAPTGSEPLRLELNLQEATFNIQPGPPGSEVKVDGTFAEGLYELKEDRETGPGGQPRTTISFKAKAPGWARMLAGWGGGGAGAPRVNVVIPRDTPIDLSLHVSLGNSQIDLGGLSLSDLDVDLSMGNHRLGFKEPLAQGPKRVNLSARMGNISVGNLGNARASSIVATGSMGNLTADLGGSWQPGGDIDVSFTQSMGELTLRAPTTLKLDASVNASQGQFENPSATDETTDPKAPVLRLRANTSMGNGRVVRY